MFEFREVQQKKLVLSLIITVLVMFIEIIGGLIANSIALISDASHMFTHTFAISLSLLAIILAKKPKCHHRTFGLYRAEVLSAFINGLFLLVIVGFIIYEAIMRLLYPGEIESIYMILVAIIGLAVNIVSILILQGNQNDNINIKGVFYHMIGDAISSIGVVFASIIIYFTDWSILDPLVSFLISALIISWAFNILRDSGRILLEMTPSGLDVHTIEEILQKEFSEIQEINHTHLWTIIPEMLVITTHIHIDNDIDHDLFLSKVNKFLSEKYSIIESTIQLSHSQEIGSCEL